MTFHLHGLQKIHNFLKDQVNLKSLLFVSMMLHLILLLKIYQAIKFFLNLPPINSSELVQQATQKS